MIENIDQLMSNCILCPRNCHVDRTAGQRGYCNAPSNITAARAALHFWEEPCISGTKGSGAVFFSGCNMGCIFCQNQPISHGNVAKGITIQRLADIYLELQEQGAHNINLVTPSHYVPQIANSLEMARNKGLSIPVLYNTSSYESVETLKMLDGLIDIYLPDCKYFSDELAIGLSNAPKYFEIATDAIKEMLRQVGTPHFLHEGRVINAEEYNEIIEETTEDDYVGPLMKKGVIIRHLVLPRQTEDSKKVIQALLQTFGNNVFLSIMGQYTPMKQLSEKSLRSELSFLKETITEDEYDELLDFAIDCGLENGFMQSLETSSESFIPAFDYKGI